MPPETRPELMLIGLGGQSEAWNRMSEQEDDDAAEIERQRVYVDEERLRILRAM
jgi:hypothetical protein